MSKWLVEIEQVGSRFDCVLVSLFPELTRSHIKLLIENGDATLNGKIVKAGEKLRLGDEISVVIPEVKKVETLPEDIDLDIIYQDDDLAVINKPQGMVVHPACGNYEHTLVNALLYKLDNLSGINGEIRPGIVHRLDKNTSGLLVVAKNDRAHNILAKQIAEKTCSRVYRALLSGVLKTEEGVVETHIARSKENRKKMAVCPDNEGKYAKTYYKVIKLYRGYSFVEFSLATGRTHQIRVHSKHLGFPVVGDDVYGRKDKRFNLNGQLLHAYMLSFNHPTTNERMTFTAPLPEYFEKALKGLLER